MTLPVVVVLFTGVHAGHATQDLPLEETSAASSVIRIDEPGVLDQPGATYLLSRDVAAPRTAFMIKGDGITLDLGGHAVTYGTEVGVDYCHGVFLRPGGGEDVFKGVPEEGFGGGDHFTLKNGRIVQGKQPVAPEGAITYRSGRIEKEEAGRPRPGRCCHAVYIRGCDGFLVDNVVTEVNSRDSNNIHVDKNIIEPREKPNPEYPSTRTHGIKLEGPARSQVHHNFCRVVAEEGFGDADPLDFDCPKYWAASINVIRAEPSNLAVVRDNVFRTNQWHFRGDWGGMQGMLLANNRFEIIGAPEDYEFFALKQSAAAATQDMVFRDNKLIPPADYRKAHLLYAKRYTRANVDLVIQWTVHIAAVDPAGKPVGAVAVIARDEQGEVVAQALTDDEGKAELTLTDYHLVGNRGDDPVLQRGPYELTFIHNDREVKKQTVDPTDTMNITVTIAEPDRRLYVYAGEDQRLTTGDVGRLHGKVVVVGDGHAKPEICWTVL
jgi:hypothetical protein